MYDPVAGWYPDPGQRQELRYWDGLQWTDHVVSAGKPGMDPVVSSSDRPRATIESPRHARWLGWAGLLLVLVAVVAVVIPGIGYGRASSEPSVTLDGRPRTVSLPPHRTYGIYVDDADNSGYSESCSVRDADGREVPMSGPPGRFSRSETETLDMMFDTGAGELTMSCSVPGERVSARPAPAQRPLVMGAVVAGIAGTLGAVSLIAWLVQRSERRPT
jgi:hypothetical protein